MKLKDIIDRVEICILVYNFIFINIFLSLYAKINYTIFKGQNTMQLIAYKAFGHPKSRLLDKAIGITSFSKYSHAELVFADGTCFSSSGRDHGARFKHFIPDPNRWDIFELDITQEEENHIRFMAELYVKKQIAYDYFGVITCGMHLCLLNKKYFCSEILAEVLGFIFEMDGFPCIYSPGKLAKYVQEPLRRL